MCTGKKTESCCWFWQASKQAMAQASFPWCWLVKLEEKWCTIDACLRFHVMTWALVTLMLDTGPEPPPSAISDLRIRAMTGTSKAVGLLRTTILSRYFKIQVLCPERDHGDWAPPRARWI